jgi:hypothetical protein
MHWVVALGLLSVFGLAAQPGFDAETLLHDIRERIRDNLNRMPDYVCTQTVERSVRSGAGAPLKTLDTLRLEVALVGNRELFSWAGASRFQEQELADLVGRGAVGTGSFALHAKTVFLTGAAEFEYRGEDVKDGRKAFRFTYSVPLEASRYRVRMQPHEAVVAFKGAFLADAETLDVIRLEVHAEDLPQKLGLIRVSDVMEYARTPIGGTDFLLPRASELTMSGAYGDESVNRAKFGACRQYSAVSTLSFETNSGPAAPTAASPISPGVILDVELESEIALSHASIGDLLTARLARAAGGLPQGATVTGRIVRLDRSTLPIEHFVLGLRLEEIETPEGRVPLAATMEEVSSVSGLIKQTKRLNPTFDRKRKPRLEILVREHQAGEGVLHWEAKRPAIPAGLRMRWRTETQ